MTLNQISIWFSHEEYLGVKWTWYRGLPASRRLTLTCLWVQ